VDAGVGVVPLVLEDQALARREAETLERAAVEPGVVVVAGDQHHRDVRRDRVEHRHRRVGRPGAEAVPEPDECSRVLGEVVAHPGDDVRRRLRTRQVEALRARGPLGEVHVVVPQPGDHPAALPVVLLDPERTVEVVPDVEHRALLDDDVDGSGPPRPPAELDDPDVAEHEVGHAHTVVACTR
jgi:hypothetical protein